MLAAQAEMLDKGVKVHPITQRTLELFVERVREHERDNLSQVILFGSVVRGEANRDSDIDVLIILKQCTFEKKMAIWDISADVERDMNFDENAYLQALPVSEKDSIGLSYYELMSNISKEGVVLYAS